MTIFVINIGNPGYSQYTLPLIEKLCKFNNVNLYVLDKDIPQNTNKLHSSWLKLFCHDLIDDDFIVCWDLDLVPTKLYNMKNLFVYDKINFCHDTNFYKQA